jgi:hypothetical protein
MDPEFRLIQMGDDWFWGVNIKNEDGLIGPFTSEDEAEKDSRETLGIRESEGLQFPRPNARPARLTECGRTRELLSSAPLSASCRLLA